MNIAVVAAGANLKAFVRSQPDGPLCTIEHSNGGLITFPGGISPRNTAGDVIGGIGVGGSPAETTTPWRKPAPRRFNRTLETRRLVEGSDHGPRGCQEINARVVTVR